MVKDGEEKDSSNGNGTHDHWLPGFEMGAERAVFGARR